MKIRVRYILLAVLVIVAAVAAGCDAPRLNPLDPENPDAVVMLISGTVLSDAKTSHPLNQATVLWRNDNIAVLSDSAGAFKLRTSRISDGYMVFSKDGYSPDSSFVSSASGKNISMVKRLNALPTLDSFFVYSIVQNKFSKAEYKIWTDVTISDPDDDIDSVYLICTALQISKSLSKTSSRRFEGRFTDGDLGLVSIDDVIGNEFRLLAVTSLGKKFTVGSTFIRRIIKEEIETLSPKNSDTVTVAAPTLRWKRFTPGFTFSYSIEVYTDEIEPRLVYRKDNISSDDVERTLETSLSAATAVQYFWVIWSYDQFKNGGRSKPAGFTLHTGK